MLKNIRVGLCHSEFASQTDLDFFMLIPDITVNASIQIYDPVNPT